MKNYFQSEFKKDLNNFLFALAAMLIILTTTVLLLNKF